MGTQTSKPLHGDEERRVRFRRPRTPVNSSNNQGEGTIDNINNSNSNSNSNSINSNSNSRTWPCANCHATVSNQESRCPYCGGIQVKIPRSPSSASKAMNSNLLLERLAATPTTPVTRRQIDPNKIHAFLSESATTSTMSYDDEDDVVVDEDVVEAEITSHIAVSSQVQPALLQTQTQPPLQEQPERPASALSQSSTLSQNFNFPLRRLSSPAMFSSSARSAASPAPSIDSIPAGARSTPTMAMNHNHNNFERPPDPVALTLEAAVLQYQQQQQLRSGTPSPQFILEQQQQQQQQQQAAAAAKRKTSSRGGDEINTDGFEVPKKKMVLPPGC